MFKNYKTSLLVVASLLAASSTMSYAVVNSSTEEVDHVTKRSLTGILEEKDFKIVQSTGLTEIKYELDLIKDGFKTGLATAKLSASLTAIYANVQLGWLNLTTFNVWGLMANVKAVKAAGSEVVEIAKQAPAAWNKAVLHAASGRYHAAKAKDAVFGWFGY